jgi:acetyltransferase
MFHVQLDGELQLLIRKVRPSDRDHLLAGFAHLSERSRFFRFLGGVTRLSEADLARFTAASSDARCAFGALDTGHDPPRPVAIARYERFDDDHRSAEMAVTVVDAYQGKGVGSLLIGTVAACAVRAGIERFVAYVHPENTGMVHLIGALGGHLESAGEAELLFDLPVHRDPALYPDTASGGMVRRAYAAMVAAPSA